MAGMGQLLVFASLFNMQMAAAESAVDAHPDLSLLHMLQTEMQQMQTAFNATAELPGQYSCPFAKASDVVKSFDLNGQTYVMTGGNKGIGMETAKALLSKGAEIIFGWRRNDGRYKQALDEIKRDSGSHKASIIKLDLSSLSSVRSFASAIKKKKSIKIHTLICNAGIVAPIPGLPAITNDGYERVFQVNFLGHFLLVEELLPILRHSKGRVVHISSVAQFLACEWSGRLPGCMHLSNLPPKVPDAPMGIPLVQVSNYGASKYLQVFHAAEIARREKDVQAYSLMPGIVDTGMVHGEAWASVICSMDKMTGPWKKCPKTVQEGAAVPAYVAGAPSSKLKNGAYYVECHPSISRKTGMIGSTGYQMKLYDLAKKWASKKSLAANETTMVV